MRSLKWCSGCIIMPPCSSASHSLLGWKGGPKVHRLIMKTMVNRALCTFGSHNIVEDTDRPSVELCLINDTRKVCVQV